MRRLALLILATSTALLAGAGSGPAASLPKARVWLGIWETNFGRIYFGDVYRARSEIPDAQGNPQYYLKIVGYWRPEGGGDSRKLEGGVDTDNNGYQTAGGCWTPSPEPTACARWYLKLRDGRLRGGYWKNCRDYCTPHHPWTGEKIRDVTRVGFRFTQRGFPDGKHGIRTQTGGAGSLIFPNPGHTGGQARASGDTTVFHIEEIATGNLQTTIRVTKGYWDESPGRQDIDLEGEISASDDPGCPVGSAVSVTLREGHGGLPDRVRLDATERGCRIDNTWTSTDPSRVSVHVTPPN